MGKMTGRGIGAVLGGAALALGLTAAAPTNNARLAAAAGLTDPSDGRNWPAYGRSYGEQHYSPLVKIDRGNVGALGLAWYYDLPAGNPVSAPLAVDGVLYTATGYSVVRAFDAASGKLLWEYDPKAPEASGMKLRQGWGIRGLAWWGGRAIVGTQDGRLIALDGKTGKLVWQAMTVTPQDMRFISGPPRVFDGKVIIGHGGADAAPTRGYVTAYDAMTGKELWRFFTVPGNPADGFEDKAQEMAAKTWAGEWWKYGGGGTVWNTFTYDPDTKTVFIGTGNGAPWNQKIRSLGKGDNLFLASVVALDADSGQYKWHYQFNPGESWDYNASMDMQLGEVDIAGKTRKVLMELPKNGFFYVLDRETGELLSATAVTRVDWARGIDLRTGRPIENPAARFPDSRPFTMLPGPNGAHTWLPSAASRRTGLVYLPVSEAPLTYNPDKDDGNWRFSKYNMFGTGYDLSLPAADAKKGATSRLVAWNPATAKEAWRVTTPGGWPGGVLATGGGLVFAGTMDGKFSARDDETGKLLWQFDAHVPVIAPPVTYEVKGVQYVTVLAGMGTSAGISPLQMPARVDYYTQPRRVLTFALGGKGAIPAYSVPPLVAPADPGWKAAPEQEALGGKLFYERCGVCHGVQLMSRGTGPDLRGSELVLDPQAFREVVHDGAFVARGMPQFGELSDAELGALRAYIRAGQAAVRAAN